MKTSALRFALSLLILPAALCASAQSNFYGGDFDQNDAFSSERNTSNPDSSIYDDFTLGIYSNVTGLYGNFFLASNTPITGLHYEVRQGITSGNGGTLINSGNVGATLVNLGTQALGLNLYRITSAPLNFSLGAGTYFLGLSAIGSGARSGAGLGQAYLATTSGTNGIGGPLANGNSFVNSASLGANFSTTEDAFGGTYDFSQGLVARPVPEPATIAALGLGAIALVRRRRRA